MRNFMKLFIFAITALLLTNVLAGEMTDDEFDAQKKLMIKLADELVPVAEQLRGKKFKFPIDKGVYTRNMIADYLIGSFEDEQLEEIQKFTQIMWKLGLCEKDADIAKAFKQLYVENIGGFYDPRMQELNIIKSSSKPTRFDKIAMVHELTHAIDDQYYDLLNGVDREDLDSDQMLAYMSVFEGTTGCVQWDYTLSRPSYNIPMVKGMILRMPGGGELGAVGRKVPELISRQMLWPYTIGLNLAFEARNRANGSFELLDKMFTDLPASTEQVLHPEKYFDEPRDNPVIIKFEEDFEKVWGDGWEKIDDDNNGEFIIWAYFLEILKGSDNIKTLAKEAAAGWDGDRMFFVHNEKLDKLSFVWRLEFDTIEDAKEFSALYEKVLQKKYKGVKEKGFVTGIETEDKSVLIFETLPEGNADEIKKKSWSAKLEDWKKPGKGTALRYSEKYTPPTKEIECENWDKRVYKEDWIEITLPRAGFKVVYDQDFTMFMAPEAVETSEFVIARMLPFNRSKLDKLGKSIIRSRINKGLTDIKLLEESENTENGYRWNYIVAGKDKNGVLRVSMTTIFEDSARKKLFQITAHGKFENMGIVSEDLNSIVDNFRTTPAKKKLQTLPKGSKTND